MCYIRLFKWSRISRYEKQGPIVLVKHRESKFQSNLERASLLQPLKQGIIFSRKEADILQNKPAAGKVVKWKRMQEHSQRGFLDNNALCSLFHSATTDKEFYCGTRVTSIQLLKINYNQCIFCIAQLGLNLIYLCIYLCI